MGAVGGKIEQKRVRSHGEEVSVLGVKQGGQYITFEQNIKGSKEVSRRHPPHSGQKGQRSQQPRCLVVPETAEKPVWLEQQARWTVDGSEVRKAIPLGRA